MHFIYGESYAKTPWNPGSKWRTQRFKSSETYQKIWKTRSANNVKSLRVNCFCRVDDENVATVGDSVWFGKRDTMSSTTLAGLEKFKILIKKNPENARSQNSINVRSETVGLFEKDVIRWIGFDGTRTFFEESHVRRRGALQWIRRRIKLSRFGHRESSSIPISWNSSGKNDCSAWVSDRGGLFFLENAERRTYKCERNSLRHRTFYCSIRTVSRPKTCVPYRTSLLATHGVR